MNANISNMAISHINKSADEKMTPREVERILFITLLTAGVSVGVTLAAETIKASFRQ